MALVKCPECSADVADAARECHNCGVPLNFAETPSRFGMMKCPVCYARVSEKAVHCPTCGHGFQSLWVSVMIGVLVAEVIMLAATFAYLKSRGVL